MQEKKDSMDLKVENIFVSAHNLLLFNVIALNGAWTRSDKSIRTFQEALSPKDNRMVFSAVQLAYYI
jgi:hypothetical protein